MERRKQDERAAGRYYKRKFRWFPHCIYCGMIAEVRDHVFPLSVAAQLQVWRQSVQSELWRGLVTVPACKECNTIAGNEVFRDPLSKRSYIQSRLREKYELDRHNVQWTFEELSELGYSLRTKILNGISKQMRAEMRVTWPLARTRIAREIISLL